MLLIFPQEHLTFGPRPASSLRHEYGDKACTVEIVRDVFAAMEHIHAFGSSHTDVIVSENADTVECFLEGTDSACTFANISSRWVFVATKTYIGYRKMDLISIRG